MKPATIIKQAMADGVSLALTTAGNIKVRGDQAAVNRWLPSIREHKPGIVVALREADNELFTFNPPGDPANDDEALRERAAIMAVENGWDEVKALQEARWCADRERCWRGFQLNAERILGVPRARREAWLARYQREASARYGESTAANMALSMAAWITGNQQ